MRFDDAVGIAKLMMRVYPQFYLSGSVALMLADKMRVRHVSDIDLVCLADDVPVDGSVVWEDDGSAPESRCTICGITCCLFIVEVIKPGPVINGIKLWDIDDIIAKKRDMDREKDRADLELIDPDWEPEDDTEA